MEKVVCACGASALELYRSSKRLIPTLLDKPRTGQVTGLSVPPRHITFSSMETADTTNVKISKSRHATALFLLGRS